MKDTAHHLKHLQKKVIQSSRKAQAVEELPIEKEAIAPVVETDVAHINKQKHLSNELRKSLVRMHVH